MLDNLRRGARSWFGKILGAVLIVGLAGFGVSSVVTNLGSTTVASVAGEDISTREFQRAYNAQLNAAAQQLGSVPTTEQALAFGIPNAVLTRLGADAALDQLGSQMGLGVSEDKLGELVRQDPAFSGTLGNFSPESFRQVLQQSGLTEAEYLDLQTRNARRQQIATALFADAAVPQAAMQLVSRYATDRRTIDYFIVSAFNVPSPAEPTEDEVARYLSEHQAEFRTVETRSADILVLTPETLAATKTVDEAAIATEYERTKADFVTPERREIVQVVLADEARAGVFEAGKAEGKSFDALVAEAGLNVTSLGTLTRAQVTDPALAEAAFSLAADDFAVIPGVAGRRAVSVRTIEPEATQTLDQARDTVAQRLALVEARNEYGDVLDQVEELRAAFRPLAEIAERFSLPLSQVELTASGEALADVEALPEESRLRAAEAIFAAQQGALSPAVSLGANRSLYFELKAVEPARDQTLDEVRDQVTAAIVAERTNAAIEAEVARLTGQIASGTPFPEVAASVNQFPQLSQPLTREGDGSAVLDRLVAGAVFSGGPRHFGSAVNAAGEHVVFQVVEVVPAAEPLNQEQTQYVTEAGRDSLYGEFVAGLRDQHGLRVNQQTLNQLLAVDASSGS